MKAFRKFQSQQSKLGTSHPRICEMSLIFEAFDPNTHNINKLARLSLVVGAHSHESSTLEGGQEEKDGKMVKNESVEAIK